MTYNNISAVCSAVYMADVKCLTPDMLVKLNNGALTRVGAIKEGDIIKTSKGNTKVIKVINPHEREGIFRINSELEVTPDHPVLAENEVFIPIMSLSVGDKIGDVIIDSMHYEHGKLNTVYLETENGVIDIYCGDNIYTIKGDY